jgi:hypothetical protein
MQVGIINQDARIDIRIGTEFYNRLQELLIWMIANQNPETVKLANERIKNDEQLEQWDEHYLTMLILINEIENAAEVQKQTSMVTIPESKGS